MSKKEQVTEQKEEKVMTKYDLKMQKRKEEKEKEKRNNRIEMIIGAVVVVALVCLVASFPIRTYMAVNKTIVKISGENISKVEFDYNYNVVKNNYVNQYGSYLSYFGMDLSGDLSTQMYSDTLSWEDYFEQQTVDSIIRGKALKAQADAAGFTYNVEEEYKNYEEGVKAAASEAGVSTGEYIKQVYGSFATMSRIKDYIKESILVNAYYEQVETDKTPSDEEIQAHYEENKNAFDSVDYKLTLVAAQLPTEPTELADPVEETEDADTTEGTEETEAYQPSEAEVGKAMADAKVLADAAEATVATDGELKENAKYSGTSGLIRDWLFDESRKEGDTTVVEDTSGNQYYVLSFVKRYLDETPSADVRIIMTAEDNGQAILDEWKNGEATEESFGALADKYNEGSSFTAEGGLYKGVSMSGTQEEIAVWLFDAARVAGDTTAITTEADGNTYILYYIGQNDPEWKMTAKSEVLADTMEDYLQEISKDIEIDDPKGNLEYLKKLEAAETAATDDTAEAETVEEATESTENTEAVDGTEAE